MNNRIEGLNSAISRILTKMFSERKRDEVKYYPYTPCAGYDPCWPSFDFGKVKDSWQEGDVAYAAAELPGPYERDMIISVSGDTDICFNGVEPERFETRGHWSYRVHFKEEKNLLVIRHKATADKFKFEIYIGVEEIPLMWPNDYLYKTRPMIPFTDLYEQEGFAYSRVYRADEVKPALAMGAIDWAGPVRPEQPEDITIDFSEFTDYSIACGVSWGKGVIRINHDAPIRVYANGEEVYAAEEGSFCLEASAETLFVVEADKTDKGFGFSVEAGAFRVPFYQTEDKDLSWLWLAGVRGVGENLQFKQPYVCEDGSETFFKYYRANTYLRPYLNTSFFGQWFYAIMVGLYGVLRMAERLEMTEYIEYFKDSMKIVCDYYDYTRFDKKTFGCPTFLYSSCKLDNLDAIGTIGMNTYEYVRLSGDESGRKLLKVLEKALDNVPRIEDGTFYRIKTFWADDFFMSIPFLTRLGGKYVAEAARHVRGFYDHLYMEDKKIFSHIYFVEEKKANRIPWGRGNGWVMLALSELLLHMPEEHPDYADMLARFRRLSEGILSYQGENGMWHQVVDDPDTYEESSGTGMFIIAMARGVKNGWLERDIVPRLWKAWERMAETCIDEEGNVLGICVGSGCHMEREYYRKLGACINDDHGMGIFLLAATEMMDLA